MTYTIYPDIMRCHEDDALYYFRNLLMLFAVGAHKVAVDRDGTVLDIYGKISYNRELIHTWLSLMSYKPSRFVAIPVCVSGIADEEQLFLTLCKSTNGQKKMIVGDIQNLHCNLDCNNCTIVDGETVQMIDKDDAVNELAMQNNSTTIIDSILANGSVSNSNNKEK